MPEAAPKGVVVDAAAGVDYSPDAVVSRTLVDSASGTLTLFAFDRGQGLSEHTAPYDATVLVLEGEAEITIAEKKFQLSAGQMVIMPANLPHAVRATRKFKMLLIMIRG
ncbi:MAG TPA: cupin domain-containing protein [Kiritimatiellae bacterium]|nr:cupin domain-containing protein [Kiritimatiellia bacterium]